ncbi:glycosyltransferase family 2 protein [Candidatus Omnitrophota bacterium]
MNPKVTVLMTVYNGERYLKECIDSVMGQTFKDFEFLIIDDHSTDRSKDIVRSYKDDRVCFIENEKNLSQVKSLNIGLSYARGAYVARMDQDDIMINNRLEKQVHFLDNRPEVSVAGTWGEAMDEEGKVFTKARLVTRFEEIIGSILFSGFILIHPSVIFRKDAVIKAGRFNESLSFSEDFELWTRLLLKGHRIVNIPEYLIRYRCHRESSSKQFPEMQLNNARIAISNFINVITDGECISELDSLSNFLINSGLMKKEFWSDGINTNESRKIVHLLGFILKKTIDYFNLGQTESYLMKRIFCNRMLNFAYQASKKAKKKSFPFYLFCLKNFGFLFTRPKLYLYPIKAIL